MAKYILLFKSKTDWTVLPKEQIVKVMDAWGEWVGSLGSKVIEPGEPFNVHGKQVTSTGTKEAKDLFSGYLVVEADNFDQALTIAQSSPTIERGGTVEVYEAFGV